MSEPLYMQARNKSLGPIEIMDTDTLSWIEKTSLPLQYPLQFVSLSDAELRMIETMRPDIEWFLSEPHAATIHGLSHCIRVMLYTAMLVKMLDGAVPVQYILAASIHDVRRLNDNEDSEHGNRAGQWFVENENLQHAYGLTAEDIKLIYAMVSWHQIDYGQIDARVLEDYKRPIEIIKAADALDRFRMPKESWWPQPERIALVEAHGLLGFCRELTILSESQILQGVNPMDAVIDAYRTLIKRKDITQI